MVISVASCLITMVSIESVNIYSVPGHTNMDTDQSLLKLLVIGFLGDGVILRRNNDVISGLTTASMVWAASALGIAIGAGFYIQATVAMVLIILAINVLPHLVKIAGPYSLRQKDLSIKITVNKHRELDGIFKQIKNLNMQVKRVKIKDIDNGASQQLEMVILAPEDLYTTELYVL